MNVSLDCHSFEACRYVRQGRALNCYHSFNRVWLNMPQVPEIAKLTYLEWRN